MSEAVEKDLLWPEEAADLLNLVPPRVKNPKKMVLAMGRRGDLETRRLGKFTMIVAESVRRFIDPNVGKVRKVG